MLYKEYPAEESCIDSISKQIPLMCRSISEIYCREFFMAYCMAFEIEGLYDNKISKRRKKGYAVKYPIRIEKKKV